MATYAGTPTVLKAWIEKDGAGRVNRLVKRLSLDLTAMGTAANPIPATALGFQAGSLERAVCIYATISAVTRVVWCFTDGTNLYIGDPTQATDANRGIPADITGTLVVEVAGIQA